MFLDASAIVAILGREPEAALFIDKIEQSKKPLFYSSLSAFEATLALARAITRRTAGDVPIKPETIDFAAAQVEGFLAEAGAREMMLGQGIGKVAVHAARTYGKAVAHAADLNLCDCMAYACAKALRVPLLFKGNDFSQTDIDQA